jgi:uncharacterized repeat protein (TIGR02543 family)
MNIWNAMNKKIAMAVILFASLFILIACGDDAPKEFIVTFNSNGGSNVTEIVVEEGDTFVLPADPTRPGYTFDDWYIDEDLETVFNDFLITQNITVYAKWTINAYTVTFNVDGGSAVTNASVNYNQTLTVPANPTKDGYNFVGWYTDEAKTQAFVSTTPITENIILYAKWAVITYQATFNFPEGSPLVVTFEDGDIITTPTPREITGYTFVGWYYDEAFTLPKGGDDTIDEDCDLYARYDKNVYTVTFESNGGSEKATENVLYEESISGENPLYEGKTFMGWFYDEELTQPFLTSDVIIADTTLYAKWEDITYTVTFETYEGSDLSAQVVNYNGKATQPQEPTYEGYTFEGWFADDAFETPFDFSLIISADVTVYAKWEVYVFRTDDEELDYDVERLMIPETATENLVLPTTGKLGTKFVWTSSSPHLLANDGSVYLAGYATGGEYVTLTAVATNGAFTENLSYEILIAERPEPVVTHSEIVDFINLSTEYLVNDGEIELFYVNNGSVPFVDIETFMFLMDGAIDTIQSEPEIITGDDNEEYVFVYYLEFEMVEVDVMSIRYIQEYSQNDEVVESYTYEAFLDFTENTYYSESFDFFDSLVASTSTNFGEGLTFGDSIVNEGTGVLIPLGDYRFDLIMHGDEEESVKYLMPLYIANLLFVGSVYYDVYYNGDVMYGIDSYQFLDGEPASITGKTSSLNSESAPLDMKIATFDYLALVFDYFYGLKDVNGIETYYDEFSSFAANIIGGRDTRHYENVFKLTYYLNDLHTYHIMTGFYVEPDYGFQVTNLSQVGPRVASYYQASWAIDDAIELEFPNGRPQLRVTADGLTAIVVIDSFTVDTPDLFKKALEDITLNYPTVINVVVDITNNGGGNVGAVWRTLGHMTDDVIYYHSQNPTEGSTVSYQIYDTYPAFNFNWYILTSPVTFSAANLMAATAKEQGIATIIGINSTGGASSISGTVLPTGDVIFFSSTNVISTIVNEEYISVEYGVQVDFDFEFFNNLYDDDYISSIVNQLQAD